MLLSFEMKIGLPICHKTCICVPVCQYLQVTNHVHTYIYISNCALVCYISFFSAKTGTSAVAHASNRDEKCVMRKWCRWCCFSWVASMYTYIYICVCVFSCMPALLGSKQHIYIYKFTSQLHASIAGEQDIYIYTHIFIYLSMVVQIYIYIYM